jgi:hypothetical protein
MNEPIEPTEKEHMSADNYYLIRKDNFGLFVPVMGFASNPAAATITYRDPRFETVEEALESITGEWSEYGTSVAPECFSSEPSTLEKAENGHYIDCIQSDPDNENYYPEEFLCSCVPLLAAWNTFIPAKRTPARS